jgi:membrane associated rhomboid family serine protease
LAFLSSSYQNLKIFTRKSWIFVRINLENFIPEFGLLGCWQKPTSQKFLNLSWADTNPGTLMNQEEKTAIAAELKLQITILGTFVAIAWFLEIIDLVFLGCGWRGGFIRRACGLDVYGILPRTLIGLRGIFFAPFLHGSIAHLISNTLPFLALGWFVMLRETRDFFTVSAITLLVSGVGTWLFGSPGFHIGASGVIFGYFGFLLLRGYFERSVRAILLSLVVGLFYGGLIWGVLPQQTGISWEGHLFGFIGGILAARMLSKSRPADHPPF